MGIIRIMTAVLLMVALLAAGYKLSTMAGGLRTWDISSNTSQLTTNILVREENPSSLGIRWNHFPLTVHIDDGFIQERNPAYRDGVIQALGIWQTTGTVSFVVVTDTDADIIIEWVSSLNENALDTLGNTDLKFVNTSQFGIIQNTGIELLIKSDSRELSPTDMINLALHEIGHAIGLQHTNEDDIMNPVLVIPSKSVKEISSRDIINLQELYKVPAKPDLKITGVNATKATFARLGRDNFYLNLSINVQNTGLVEVDNFNMRLSTDNNVINEDTYQKLDPGSTLTIFQGNLRVDRNFTSIQISLDPENAIDELDETNNFVNVEV